MNDNILYVKGTESDEDIRKYHVEYFSSTTRLEQAYKAFTKMIDEVNKE